MIWLVNTLFYIHCPSWFNIPDDIFANEVLNSLEKRPLGDNEDLNETLNEIPSGKSENEKQETVEKQDKIDEKVKTQEPNTKTEKGKSVLHVIQL